MRKKRSAGSVKPRRHRPAPGLEYFPPGPLPMFFGVCFTEAAFASEMRRLRVKDPGRFISSEGCSGTVHSFVNEDRRPRLTVIMALDAGGILKAGTAAAASIVAHEAVHCMRSALEEMEEKAPGEEVEAYLTDWFALCAMRALLQWAKRERR